MLINLTIGLGLVAVTVLAHILGLIWITHAMNWMVARFRWHEGSVLAMITVVLGLFLLLLAEVWIWALCYEVLGAFPDFMTSLYFSITSFATLGIGDVVPVSRWRILGALESLNGFLLIGWSTAYIISASMRLGPFRSGEHF
jgi:ion channel